MIHLIVGNTGSGKTTYSQKLKDEIDGVVYSIDKWNNTLFLPDKKEDDGLAWFLERIDRVESIISDLILQLDSVGIDAILDLALSKFEHRDKFRDFANKHNIKIILHLLDIPKETRRGRVLQRNNDKGETFEFEVTNENFEFMEKWFERPTDIELENGVIIKE